MRRHNFGRPWTWDQTSSGSIAGSGCGHCGLGSIALREGDIPGAIAEYQQALELDPDFTIAHVNLGGLLAMQGRLDEAILHFRRSVELQPDNASITAWPSPWLAPEEDTGERANLNKALAIDPNFCGGKTKS